MRFNRFSSTVRLAVASAAVRWRNALRFSALRCYVSGGEAPNTPPPKAQSKKVFLLLFLQKKKFLTLLGQWPEILA